MRILSRYMEEQWYRLLDKRNDTIYGQALLIQANEKEIAYLRWMLLGTYRASRDMARGMRGQDLDDETAEDLDAIVSELSDQIAQLEEHYVA